MLPEFARLVRALNDANVSVYPVDARGLLAVAAHHDPFTGDRPRPVGETSYPQERVTLQQIADQTGGRFFYGKEVNEALPAVLEDARVSYTLGYYPSNQNYDGRFRRVTIKIPRPGVKLRYRAGYHAVPGAGSDEERRKGELLGAVWSPIDATAIALDAALETSAAMPADTRALVIHVDGSALTFEPREKRLGCVLDLFVVQKNAEGKQIDGTFDNLDITTTEARARSLQQRGYTHRKECKRKPGAAILRLVVRNAATGALGSLSIPLAGGQ